VRARALADDAIDAGLSARHERDPRAAAMQLADERQTETRRAAGHRDAQTFQWIHNASDARPKPSRSIGPVVPAISKVISLLSRSVVEAVDFEKLIFKK